MIFPWEQNLNLSLTDGKSFVPYSQAVSFPEISNAWQE
jgi:hypothetical protein